VATIDHTQVAILYETITGTCQLRGKIVIVGPETIDVTAFLAKHPGLSAVIRSAALPRDDTSCRQAIALATGKSVLTGNEDRCVQVSAGTVVSENHGNVPGLDAPDAGHQMITHPTAKVGDTFAAGVFSRRYVLAVKTTGTVQSVVTLPLGSLPSPTAAQFYAESLIAIVGNTIPKPR
jgi:hypothetical protein